MPATALWKKVTDTLAAQFAERRFAPGERFYTLKELSRRFQVSEITGRRVMDELRDRHLIECIHGRGTFVRQTAVERIVKLLLHPILGEAGYSHQYLVQEVLRGMQLAAGAANCQLHLVSTDHFADHVQAGDLVASIWHSRHMEALQLAVDRGARVVCAHAPQPMPGIGTVRPDFAEGIAQATRHLVARRHRRIAYLTGAVGHVWFSGRFDGYFHALRQAGLPLDLALVQETASEHGSDVAPALAALLAVPDPPTAVVCANDGRALALMRAARERGLRLPDDLAVVGFDNIHDGAWSSPALTTVDQFWARQGEQAIGLLLRPQDGAPEDILIAPRLVLRASG
jgi:DNA-binding LacI/PurR family transcriptional regulator